MATASHWDRVRSEGERDGNTRWLAAGVAGLWLVVMPATLAYAVPGLASFSGVGWSVLLVACALGLFVFGVTRAVRQRQPKAAVRTEGRRLRQLAEMSTGGVMILDGGDRVVATNRVMRALLSAAGGLEGRVLGEVLPARELRGMPDGAEIETELWGSDGALPVRLSRRTIMHRGRPFTVVTVLDQRARLRQEEEVLRLRTTDALTGLANRTQFQALVRDRFVAHGQGTGTPFTFLLLGLDRFKSVNDSMGHAAGDELLNRLAARLLAVPTGAIAVGRLGGDQFGLLLDEGDGTRVQLLGSSLIDVLTRWLCTEGRAPNVGVSAGFALAPADGSDEERLSTCAELALRRAKDDGKGVCRPYETGLAEQARKRHGLELSLRRAIAERQFEVHFQPQSNLVTGEFEGAEALIRWRHPERGTMWPSDFLPIAEETGLIDEIGEWVLRTACTAAAQWPSHLRVAVNLSAVQLRKPNLAETFGRILSETGFAPERLELEVTESVLVQDEQRVLATLQQLRSMGIRIALDDFGTGYSSLSYLRRFPFDKIKLDKSFIRQAPDDDGDAAIVTAILTLGRSLGMATTAEGVETERQSDFVISKGCTQGQGWFIGKPMPDDQLPDAFRRPGGRTPGR